MEETATANAKTEAKAKAKPEAKANADPSPLKRVRDDSHSAGLRAQRILDAEPRGHPDVFDCEYQAQQDFHW